MATPVIRERLQAADNGDGGGLAITLTTAATTQAGDLLVCFHGSDYLGSAAMTTPTGTAGTWTLRATGDQGTNNPHIKVWTRPVTTNGAQTVTVPQNSNAGNYQILYVLTGQHATPIDGAAGGQGASTTTMLVPSISPVGDNDLLLNAYLTSVGDYTATNHNAAAGTLLTKDIEVDALYSTMSSWRQALTVAGATGTTSRTVTAAVAHPYASATIAIRGLLDVVDTPVTDSGGSVETVSVEMTEIPTVPTTVTDSGDSTDTVTVDTIEVVPTLADSGDGTDTATIVVNDLYPPHVRNIAVGTSNTTTVTVAKPVGTVSGDTLIAVVLNDYLAATSTGWTVTYAAGASAQDTAFNLMRKTAGASEPASYSFSVGASTSSIVAIVAFKGTHVQADTWDVAPSVDTLVLVTATTTPAAVSITPTTASPLLITAYGTKQATSGFAGHQPPPGMAELVDSSFTTPGRALFVAAQSVPQGAATGARAATSAGTATDYVTVSMALVGLVQPVNLTDSGDATDTATIAMTDVKDLLDAGDGSDVSTVFSDSDAVIDSGDGAETITIDQLTDVVVTDSGAGADVLEVADFIGNDLVEAAPGVDAVTVDRTNFVDLTDTGDGVDAWLLEQTRDLVDAGAGVDVVAGLGAIDLADSAEGTDTVSVVDIPFTQVLPLRNLTVYDVVVVARIPQASGPPTFIEVDPIEWKSLTYTNTLSTAQDLTASCLISSVTESVLQRLRRLHELATELWLYRDGQIVFAGPLQGFQTSGETLTLKAQGLQAYLRMMVINADTTFTNADQLTMVKSLVDQWQVLDFGNFGIDTSNVGVSGQLRTETYLRDELHNVGQRVEELGKAANGFDIEVDPASRKLQLWFPTKGIDRSSGEDAIVLDARNITSGDILCSVAPGDLASEAYGTAHASGQDTTLFSVQANLELRSRYGRCAVTATWSDTSQQSTLDNYTRGLLDARGEALLVPGPKIRVTPDADLGDYGVGDTIAYELGNQLGISGAFRIRKQVVTASSSGQESVDLEFV